MPPPNLKQSTDDDRQLHDVDDVDLLAARPIAVRELRQSIHHAGWSAGAGRNVRREPEGRHDEHHAAMRNQAGAKHQRSREAAVLANHPAHDVCTSSSQSLRLVTGQRVAFRPLLDRYRLDYQDLMLEVRLEAPLLALNLLAVVVNVA